MVQGMDRGMIFMGMTAFISGGRYKSTTMLSQNPQSLKHLWFHFLLPLSNVAHSLLIAFHYLCANRSLDHGNNMSVCCCLHPHVCVSLPFSFYQCKQIKPIPLDTNPVTFWPYGARKAHMSQHPLWHTDMYLLNVRWGFPLSLSLWTTQSRHRRISDWKCELGEAGRWQLCDQPCRLRNLDLAYCSMLEECKHLSIYHSVTSMRLFTHLYWKLWWILIPCCCKDIFSKWVIKKYERH